MSKHQYESLSLATLVERRLLSGNPFKPFCIAIASLMTFGLVTTAKPVRAFSITYDITVQVTTDTYAAQGLLNGSTASGSLTYDNATLTGIGSEYVSGLRGNLTIQFNFLNKIYTEKNDLNYGNNSYLYDYPSLFFANGTLLGLDFLVVPSKFQPPQNDLGFRLFNTAFYAGAIDNFNSGTLAGTVTYSRAAVVPDPVIPDPVIPTPPGPNPVPPDPVIPDPVIPIPPGPDPGTPNPGNAAAVPEPSDLGGAIVAFSVLGLWAAKRRGVRGEE